MSIHDSDGEGKEFYIPITQNDLLDGGEGGRNSEHYFVENVLSLTIIPTKVYECKSAFTKQGPTAVLTNFDILFSVIRRFSDVDDDTREVCWTALLKAISKQRENLQDNGVDQGERKEQRNTLKMNAYLLCLFIDAFENNNKSQALSLSAAKPKGKKKKATVVLASGFNWAEEKDLAIMRLYQLIQLDLALLWQPPVVEEDFINLVANCCYKLLENPDTVKTKTTKEGIYMIIGIFIRRYKHAAIGAMKIVQLLRHFEHLPLPLAEAVVHFYTEHNTKDILGEIIGEIGQIDMDQLFRDTAGTKSLSTFIVEIAQKIPSAFLPNVMYLINYLDKEIVVLRMSVLSVFGEVISQELSKEDLSDKEKATRDEILNRLEDHIHDKNAFVRFKAVTIWCNLCNKHQIPLSRLKVLVAIVIGRLDDKSCLVRRGALQLLQAFLICNPFSFKLCIDELRANVELQEEKLRVMTPEEVPALEVADEDCDGSEDQSMSIVQELLGPMQEGQSQQSEEPSELAKQRVLVLYLKDSLLFALNFETAIPRIKRLISSKVNTDVLEAIDFFVVLFEFKVDKALDGVRRMLTLVWSEEPLVKAAVVNAYKRLYLHSETDKRAISKSVEVVNNLTSLLNNVTYGDLACLEVIICEFMKTGDIDNSVIQLLWARFTMKSADTSPDESRVALILISMLAGANVDIVRSNVDVLVRVGLGERGRHDLSLVLHTCNTLLKLVTEEKVKGAIPSAPLRFPMKHDIITNLVDIHITTIFEMNNSGWISMTNSAIKTIYRLSEHPDQVCSELIMEIISRVSQDHINKPDGVEMPMTSGVLVPTFIVARFLSLLGQIALWQVIHLEVHIVNEIKRRQRLLEEKKLNKGRKRKSTMSRLSTVSRIESGVDDDMGMVCGSAEDVEADYIRDVVEREIVTGDNLLSKLKPIMLKVCSEFHLNHDTTLRSVASIALAKLMLVSSQCCMDNLPLLFKILECDPEPAIRGNLIIAFGDLMVRFPNQVAPGTKNLYARLRDESSHVRKNTVNVLTHLILNDMVQVKGQISEMAACIVDPDDTIASMTKRFFLELSKKGNSVYNIMPDVISRLSDPDVGVNSDDFRVILKYLLNFIQKDKQAESLVEKLCHRFRTTKSDRQNHDLIYCISLLANTEKCLQKLQDNLTCYADKLADDTIYTTLSSVIGKVKKAVKPDLRVLIEEFEARIEQMHMKGMEDEVITSNIPEHPKTKSKRTKPSVPSVSAAVTPRRRQQRNKKTAAAVYSSPDDDDEVFQKTPAPPARGRKTRNRPIATIDSSSEEDAPFSDAENQDKENSNPYNSGDTITPFNNKVVSRVCRRQRLHTPTRVE